MAKEKKSLENSLARMVAALGLTEPALPAVRPAREPSPVVRSAREPSPEAAPSERRDAGSSAGTVFGVLAVVLAVAAQRTHETYLWALALGSAATVAALYARRVTSIVLTTLQGGPISSTHASIGLGATIAESAVIEPGASVEMGATIGRGAIVRCARRRIRNRSRASKKIGRRWRSGSQASTTRSSGSRCGARSPPSTS